MEMFFEHLHNHAVDKIEGCFRLIVGGCVNSSILKLILELTLELILELILERYWCIKLF